MKRSLAPSVADILFMVIAPLTAIGRSTKLTHSDGDLAAHIRMGEVMIASGQIPSASLSSFTTPAEPLIAHAWLSEIFLAGLDRMGGLALISVVTGIIVALTHAAIVLFLRRLGVDARWALAAGMASLAVSSTHWLARPHMFSIAGVALTLILLELRPRYRVMSFAALFTVWANLHGGWAYGLMMIAVFVAGHLVEAGLSGKPRELHLRLARDDTAALAAAVAGTMFNPFGLALHREVLHAATSTELARQMGEFLPPDFTTAAPLPFLVVVLASVGLVGVSRKRPSVPHMILIAISFALALRSFRNIALFGVSAWPLIALHAARWWPAQRRRFRLFSNVARLDATTIAGLYALPVGVALIAVGIANGRVAGVQAIPDGFNPKVFPVLAVAKARAAGFEGRMFEPWVWGGYIMYAWPSARLIVDPLKFDSTSVKAYSVIDSARPGWREEISRWSIRTAIVRPDSPLAVALAADSMWKVWYRDSTAVVFRPRSEAAPVPQTP